MSTAVNLFSLHSTHAQKKIHFQGSFTVLIRFFSVSPACNFSVFKMKIMPNIRTQRVILYVTMRSDINHTSYIVFTVYHTLPISVSSVFPFILHFLVLRCCYINSSYKFPIHRHAYCNVCQFLHIRHSVLTMTVYSDLKNTLSAIPLTSEYEVTYHRNPVMQPRVTQKNKPN
jgi:hypothetical protein